MKLIIDQTKAVNNLEVRGYVIKHIKNQLFIMAKRARIVSIMAPSNSSFLSIAYFFFIFLYFKSYY